MAITSIGYDGTIDEVSWVKLQKATASVYGVSTSDSWKVTAVAGADRTISIAPGSGWGHHVFDESDTNYTLQGATVSSGSRWDMVVLRRDWAAIGGGPSAFRLNPGNASRTLPARTNNPGVRDDQPIALVQFSAGKTQPNAIIDLRAWAANGGVEVADSLALDYLAVPGAAVKHGRDVLRFELQANGVWGWSNGDTEWRDCFLGSTAGVPNVRHPGSWQKVKDAPCQARLVGGGRFLQVRGELNYVNTGTPSYLPEEGWPVARVPDGMYPSAQTFITGTTDRYKRSQMYVIQPNGNITIGPGFSGTIAQFNGLAPL